MTTAIFTEEEIKRVILKDKREIYLDDDEFSLSVVINGKIQFSHSLTYPTAGYGGGSLWLSPSHSYLLFTYYSGQSEEGFRLFRINDKIETIFELPYLMGETASYCFSEDEKLLIQVLLDNCTPWEFDLEDLSEKDENGNMYYNFGQINILDIVNKGISEHKIHIYQDYWHCLKKEFDRFISPELINADTLKISMPWGNETLNFPIKDTIIFGH